MSPPEVNEPLMHIVGYVSYVYLFVLASFVSTTFISGKKILYGYNKGKKSDDEDDSNLLPKNGDPNEVEVKQNMIKRMEVSWWDIVIKLVLFLITLTFVVLVAITKHAMFTIPTNPALAQYLPLARHYEVWKIMTMTSIVYWISLMYKYYLADNSHKDLLNDNNVDEAPGLQLPYIGYSSKYLEKFIIGDTIKVSEKLAKDLIMNDAQSGQMFHLSTRAPVFHHFIVLLAYYVFFLYMTAWCMTVMAKSFYSYTGRPAISVQDSIYMAAGVFICFEFALAYLVSGNRLTIFLHRGHLYNQLNGRVLMMCVPIAVIISYNFLLLGAFVEFFNTYTQVFVAVSITQILPVVYAAWNETLAAWLDYHLVCVMLFTHCYFFLTEFVVQSYGQNNAMGVPQGQFKYLEFMEQYNSTQCSYEMSNLNAFQYFNSQMAIVTALVGMFVQFAFYRKYSFLRTQYIKNMGENLFRRSRSG